MVEEISKDHKFTYGLELQKLVVEELPNCIGCNECMRVCPVSKSPDLTIALLNEALTNEDEPKGIVKDFALNCCQCGRCVPVCPPGVRRDLMVLYTKSKIKSYPSSYNAYVRLKQPDPPAAARAIYALKKKTMKKALGRLNDVIDTDELGEAELLFYPGCYIFNEVCHKTVAIMEYLGEDFEIMGGYTKCCGWPQYLQGRLEMADVFLERLWKCISKINPKRIITTCAECYAALRKIKAVYNADFIPLTTTEYFLQNVERLPIVKFTDKKLGFHDSCHISRKYRKEDTPRKLLEHFGGYYELENNKANSKCCYYYNFENDPENHNHRIERIQEVKDVADVMVSECITCYEVFKEKMGDEELEDFEIFDFNEMVYHCIQLEEEKKTEGEN